MNGLTNGPKGSDWYVVAGYRGEEPTQETADFVVVHASDSAAAVEQAGQQSEGFNPVSALSETELRSFLAKIDAQKVAGKS